MYLYQLSGLDHVQVNWANLPTYILEFTFGQLQFSILHDLGRRPSNNKYILLTNTGILDTFSNTSFEKTRTSITTVYAIMFTKGFISTNFTQNRHR